MNDTTRIIPVRSRQQSVGPDGDRLIALAKSLASPVAAGQLRLAQADATLLTSAIRAAREGSIKFDPLDYARILQHVLRLNLHERAFRRLLAQAAIKKTIAPMIAVRAAPRRLFAEAHNANADYGFPLKEHEVHEAVSLLVFSFLHPDSEAQE